MLVETTVIQLLIEARARVQAGFCHDAYARDAYGVEVDPQSVHACSFCGVGALRAVEEFNEETVQDALELLSLAARTGDFLTWQDTRTQAEILRVYDRAIRGAHNA